MITLLIWFSLCWLCLVRVNVSSCKQICFLSLRNLSQASVLSIRAPDSCSTLMVGHFVRIPSASFPRSLRRFDHFPHLEGCR